MNRSLLSLALVLVFAFACGSRTSAQTTFNVPSASYPTIQSAVLAAANGDTILIGPGLFVEDVVIGPARAIEFIGAGKGVTTIRATGATPAVFDFITALSSSSAIRFEQLTIDGLPTAAGAVFPNVRGIHGPASGTAPIELSQVEFLQCHSTSLNAAVQAGTTSRVLVEDCDFVGCTGLRALRLFEATVRRTSFVNCEGNPLLLGGGAGTLQVVEDCQFIGNHLLSPGTGSTSGAITTPSLSETTLLVRRCRFTANLYAPLVVSAAVCKIENCLFNENSGIFAGSVADLRVDALTIDSCTFARNGQVFFADYMLKTRRRDSSVPTAPTLRIRNTIFAENDEPRIEFNVVENAGVGAPVMLDIQRCIFEVAPDTIGLAPGTPLSGDYVIEQNQHFVDSLANDFALRTGSRAVDGGIAAGAAGTLDLNGSTRTVGAAADIGCLELQSQMPGAAWDGTSPSGDLLLFNGTAGGPRRTLTVPAGSPCTIAVQAPSGTSSAPFIIWGYVGSPAPSEAFAIPFAGGDMAFTPHLIDLGNPKLFTFTNNILPPASGLVGSTPAPWSVAGNCLPYPFSITIQGLVTDGSGPLRITNAMTLHTR